MTRFFTIVVLSTLCISSVAQAGIIQAYSGTNRTQTTAAQQITNNFAVFSRFTGASTPGDVFGTGRAGFDSVSPIDTSVTYLYVFQNVAGSGTPFTPFSNYALSDGQVRFNGVTSTAQWPLFLADDAGPISISNAFGQDVAFQNSAPATLGVINPSIVESATAVRQVTISISPTSFQGNYVGTLPPNTVSTLFGFTTNTPPDLLTTAPSSSFFAGGTVLAPQAVPEPSTLMLAGLGLLALFTMRRRR